MRNRQGSTLVMTLLIFTVLMIFGTFILGFMVTENKQSLHHQYKTQAHYIARARAVAVEAAIKQDGELLNELKKMGNGSTKEVEVSYEDQGKPVVIKKVIDEENEYLEIISESSVEDVSDTVTKVLEIKAGESVKIDKVFTIISGEKDAENHIPGPGDKLYTKINENIKFNANTTEFKPYIFDSEGENDKRIYSKLPENNKYGEEGKIKNYKFDKNFEIKGRIIIEGTVNIFVKGNVTIDGDKNQLYSVNNNGKPNKREDFNIYILENENMRENDDTERLKIYLKNQENVLNGNVYVGSGNIDIFLQKSQLNMNIVSNGKYVYLNSQTGNVDHAELNGNIYAPNAEVTMSLNALTLDGYVVSKHLKFYHRNDKDFPKNAGKLKFKNGEEQELDNSGKPKINSSYFK